MPNKDRSTTPSTLVAIDGGQFRELTIRLDAVVKLLASNLPEDMKQETKVKLLSDAGLQPKDIAKILDTSPNAVSVALSKIRRRERIGENSEETKVAHAEKDEPERPVEPPQAHSGAQAQNGNARG